MTIAGKRPLLLASLVLLFVASAAAPAAAAPVKPPERLTADFTMTRTLKILSDAITSRGKLVLGGPGRLRFEVTAPSRSILVIDAGKGWIRYPDLNVSRSFELGADPVMRVLSEHLLVLTSGDLEKAGAFYTVTDAAEAGVKRLVPRQPEIASLFSEMRVALGAGGVVSWVELVSANGDVTRIAFANVRVDPVLDASLFEKP
jgi:outer membrane lipoprotein-sorting protein